MSKNTRTRILLVAVAALLLVTLTVGGTLAWLQDTSETVVNKFSPSTIKVELDEDKPTGQQAQMIPGADIEKDPKVTVTSPDTAAWVFIVVEESDNFDDFLTYSVEASWIRYDGTDSRQEGVYYKEVAKGTTADIQILTDNKVTVLEDVEKEDMEAMYTNTALYPELSFTAYTVQKDANVDTAAEAYAILFPTT